MTKMLRRNWRLLSVLLGLLVVVSIFSRCVEKKREIITNKKGEKFAGSEACRNCHKDIYDHFIETAHNLTSRPATEETVKKASGPDPAGFAYNIFSRVNIQQRDGSFYQIEYYKGAEKSVHRMDITIGSGTRGQTYLSWNNDNLFQLPVSFFTSTGSWANSPDFPPAIPKFNRIIYARCLECHATYADYPPQHKDEAVANKTQILYGVSCERCHGTAEKHVEFHTQNPDKKKGEFIINPAAFTRVQSLDMCALCHSGKRTPVQPVFSFTAGNDMNNFFQPVDTATTTESLDVHVNQSGLLMKSKCFQNTKTLTCNTCHNTHNQERGNAAIFSQRCMTCHKQEQCHFCLQNPSLSSALTSNCIDCHMPVEDSKILTVQLEENDKTSPAKIRSHLIGIYPAATKKVLDFINRKS